MLPLHRQVVETWYLFGSSYVRTRMRLRAETVERPPRNEILFLHGRYGDAEICDLVAEKLDGMTEFTSMDFPGFGRSYTATGLPLSVSDHLELSLAVSRHRLRENPESRLVLLGHDFGALIAQLTMCVLSADFPGRIDLVLVSPLTLGWGRLDELPRWLYGIAARRELRGFFRKSLLLEEDQKGRLYPPRSKVLSRIIQSWPGPAESAMWRSKMANFPGSLLVLWGARAPLKPTLLARDILNLYKNVECFEHPQAGHWPFLEDPVWVAEKIRVFLFRTERPLKAA